MASGMGRCECTTWYCLRWISRHNFPAAAHSRMAELSSQEVDRDPARCEQIHPMRFVRAATGTIRAQYVDLVVLFSPVRRRGRRP